MQDQTDVEDVEFYSDGTRMSGELFTPPDGTESLGAVVVCHGFGGIKEFYLGDIARTLAAHGHVALTFDYRGFGESDGRRGRLFPLEQVEDTVAAVDFLSTRVDAERTRIGIYGTSFGGGVALAAAGSSPQVGAAVSAVGIGDCYRWLRSLRRYWEWVEFERRVDADRIQAALTGVSETVEPEEIMVRDPESIENERRLRAEYPKRAFKLDLASARAIMRFRPLDHVGFELPRFFIGVDEDTLTPYSETVELYETSVGPKELLTLTGLTHHEMYQPQHLTGVLESVSGFFRQHLARS